MGWGKSVALPSQALPAPPPGQMAIRSKEVRHISSFIIDTFFLSINSILYLLFDS